MLNSVVLNSPSGFKIVDFYCTNCDTEALYDMKLELFGDSIAITITSNTD